MTRLDERLAEAAEDVSTWSPAPPPAGGVDAVRRRAAALRQRRMLAAGAAPVVGVVLVVAGLLVSAQGRSDDGPRLDVAAEGATTSAPLVTAETGTATLDDLPREGIAVGGDGYVVLLDDSGRVLHRLDGFRLATQEWGPGDLVLNGPDGRYVLDAARGRLARSDDDVDGTRVELAYGAVLYRESRARVERDGELLFDLGSAEPAISYDGDIVTALGANAPVAFDVRSSTTRALPDGCRVADRHDDRWFLLCNDHTELLHLAEQDFPSVLLTTGPAARGEDAAVIPSAMVSPNGEIVIAEIARDCKSSVSFVGLGTKDGYGGIGSKVGGQEHDVKPLGWMRNGDPIFVSANCGGMQGVTAMRGDSLVPLFAAPLGAGALTAALWAPPLGSPSSTSGS